MAGTLTLGNETFPFDEDVFADRFQNIPDLVTNAMLSSGAMVEDAQIAGLVGVQGNQFTIPFYGNLADDEDDNYDGQTDITLSTISGFSQSGTVFGRAHAWKTLDFAADFTAADPIGAIVARMAKYSQTRTQHRLIGVSEAALGSALSSHVVTETGGITPTILSDVAQRIWGEHKGMASMAIMHSDIAQQFEDLQRVEYLQFTDPNGVTRSLNVFEVNGLRVIIDDSVPTQLSGATGAGVYTVKFSGSFAVGEKVTVCGTTVILDATSAASATAVATAVVSALGTMADYTLNHSTDTITFTEKSGHYGAGAPTANVVSTTGGKVVVATTTAPAGATKLYSTYLFGAGAIRHAVAPVKNPFFAGRNELEDGGYEFVGFRRREAIHPNGFNYSIPAGVKSVSDAQLFDASKYSLAYPDDRLIPFGKLLTPAAVAV